MNNVVRKFLFTTIAVWVSAASASAEEVVYQQTSTSRAIVLSGTQPAGAYPEFTLYNQSVRSIKVVPVGGSMTLTLNGYQGKRISRVVLSLMGDRGALGTATVKSGSDTWASVALDDWLQSHTSAYSDFAVTPANPNYVIGNGESVTIQVKATTNPYSCQSFKIIYDDAAVSFKATDGDNYYASFSHDDAVTFPKQLADGRKLHAEVLTVENDVISIKDLVDDFGLEADGQIIVPAKTGVLLRVEGADSAPVVEYSIRANDADEQAVAAMQASNMLIPCLATGNCPMGEGANVYYKLAYGDNTTQQNLGFWYGAESGTNDFLVKGNGAVLCVPQSVSSNVRGFSLENIGTLTGLETTAGEKAAGAAYDLKGKSARSGQKGLSIKNGRKFMNL